MPVDGDDFEIKYLQEEDHFDLIQSPEHCKVKIERKDTVIVKRVWESLRFGHIKRNGAFINETLPDWDPLPLWLCRPCYILRFTLPLHKAKVKCKGRVCWRW